MYAMQYQITLPTDYDMQIIRDRVTRTGHLMDGYHGLEFKAYLIQENAKGAPRNAYAPFYVWRDIDGMRQFCWSEPATRPSCATSAATRSTTGLSTSLLPARPTTPQPEA